MQSASHGSEMLLPSSQMENLYKKRGQNLPHLMFPFSSAVVKIRQTCRLQLLIEANVCVTRAGLRSDPGNTALG